MIIDLIKRAALVLCFAAAGCGEFDMNDALPTEPPTGPWQAVIVLPGGGIETAFELERNEAGYQATLVNGQERIEIGDVRFADGELLLRFPVFNNEIRARFDGRELQGKLTLVKQFGATQELPFRAAPGTEHTHAPAIEAARVDLSGRWAVRFAGADGSSRPSIGEFAQRGPRLFGTFVNTDGDHRYLAGHVEGRSFKLSTFDGAHAFLFTGTVEDDTIINADFWSGNAWHQTWTAERDDDVALPDPYAAAQLKQGFDRVSFELANERGELVSMPNETYAGKVCVIFLGGSWCPNCNDEASFLSELYEQYHEQGLEIVALMFEHFEEPDLASERVKRFREKHSLEFETLLAGISDKADALKAVPALQNVYAFPTTIFIDRAGKVRKIHSGFSGPGTGEYHERLRAEFDGIITELLAEQEADSPADYAEPAS